MGVTDADLKALTSEHALVGQATEGVELAFAELYRRHGDAAWRLSLAATGNTVDAETAVAASFATVFGALKAGRQSSEAPFRPSLLTAARNAAVDAERSRRAIIGDDAAAGWSVPGDELDERTAAVAAAFGRLPERWRTVLWLTEVEGLDARDAAPVVGLSETAASQLAVRARRGLREQYLAVTTEGSTERTCSRAIARLGAYVSGSLNAADHAKLRRHLDLCDTCATRHADLEAVRTRIGLLAVPIPLALVDPTKAAWLAAITESRETAGILSPTAEKLVAGVSAVAAALGVVGATIYGLSRADTSDAAEAAPQELTDNGSEPVDGDAALGLPRDGKGITIRAPRADYDAATTVSRFGVTGESADDSDRSVVPTGAPGTGGPGDTPTVDLEPGDGDVDDNDGGDGGDGPGGSDDGPGASSDPVVSVGTTVGGTPVAVDVGPEPGVTAGPVSVGSEPQPNDDLVTVDGPLGALAPAVDPVNDVAGGLGL